MYWRSLMRKAISQVASIRPFVDKLASPDDSLNQLGIKHLFLYFILYKDGDEKINAAECHDLYRDELYN
jgi:hypothetical protein